MPRRLGLLVPAPARMHPLRWAILFTTLTCLTAGTAIGLAAGMVAGTFVLPLIGTAYGGLVGIWIGLLVSTIVTPVVVIVLVARHRGVRSPHAPLPDVARVATVLATLLLITGLGVVMSFLDDQLLVVLWALVVVCATAATVVVTLRAAAKAISVAWCRPFGWVTDGSRTMLFGQRSGAPIWASSGPGSSGSAAQNAADVV